MNVRFYCLEYTVTITWLEMIQRHGPLPEFNLDAWAADLATEENQ